MDTFTYFGYGSNMLTYKLKDRCPSAVPIGICKIKKHSLKFHKVSHAISKKNRIRDISGKGDMVPSESETDEVYGVLFSIDKSEESSLDKAEGYPKYGYDKKKIDVITTKGEKYRSIMYFAKEIDPKIVIPMHYGMFKEAGPGKPEIFLDNLRRFGVKSKPVLMSVGKSFVYTSK